MAEQVTAGLGLAGRSFGALFRGDLEPEVIAFEVDGQPCSVTLRKMDKTARDEFLRKSGNGIPTPENQAELMRHMVGNTVLDYRLWTKARRSAEDGGGFRWQEVRPPQNAKAADLAAALERFQVLPEFWDALIASCSEVNGFTERDSGN